MEWRVIPGFSKYEINAEGQVRKVDTKLELYHLKYKTYALANDDGHITTRAQATLLALTFPNESK